MILNGMNVTKAFNINDKTLPFTEQILCGTKTEETRACHSLDSLIGMTVAIVRTGKGKAKIVGTCKIAGSVEYHSEHDFDQAYDRHRVAHGSKFDFAHAKKGFKVGYLLEDVQRLETPVDCPSRGIVIRNI